MPRPGYSWRHIVLGTHGSWLPADPRGFHSRDHRIHSSGDYRNPPPPDEHSGLRDWVDSQSREAVVIPADLREQVGQALEASMKKENCRTLAISVSGMHAHLLVELPVDHHAADAIMARCKGRASHAVHDEIPGRVWSRGATVKDITDEQHHRATYHYILKQSDAWVWDFKKEESGPEGHGVHGGRIRP